ncbi:BlaI/MecI/CopY family transcriptional regulator [Cognaticolwellia aestuarii]|uniref:BlaI/MecI/CopY family transcriptional regulator n=1 Tax=Cognaticolwellia aestuarii TaxID=329993 RepID=UPI000987987A|nr:BlaI/MecI/CopY family transcriptional regulator [Cognaticolwellia aestuarii]
MQLGELEKMVLQYLWQHKSADVKEVYNHFEKIRGGSLNTYQSTLDRLYKKELLSRYKVINAYQYQPKIGRHELIGQLIKSVTNDFVTDENSLVAAFSSISQDFNEEQLDKLDALIEAQRIKLAQDK